MGGHGLYALDRRVHEVHPHVAERRGGAARPRAQEGDGRGRRPQRPAGAPDGRDAARRHSDAVERCRVLPRPEEILVLTFMVNDEDAPTGRPAGAIGWAGLANTFYWIDRKNGFGGYWATQILPFGDPTSFGGYLDFETAAYATGEARAAA